MRARFEVSQPEVLTAELSGLGIKELVSEFSTPYSCCEPRVTNIQTAAKALDGTIIPAGNRFSLNAALGARTEDRGYVAAPQIAGGKLEDAVGGGVSQVSTTLYNAAFFAGLDLEAHTPHSFYISRYPMGREATLSMGGPELIFKNDWDAAILMSVTAGDNDVTVRFFSTKLGRRVETTTGEPRDYVEPEVEEVFDPSLEPGTREVEQESGGAGFTIVLHAHRLPERQGPQRTDLHVDLLAEERVHQGRPGAHPAPGHRRRRRRAAVGNDHRILLRRGHGAGAATGADAPGRPPAAPVGGRSRAAAAPPLTGGRRRHPRSGGEEALQLGRGEVRAFLRHEMPARKGRTADGTCHRPPLREHVVQTVHGPLLPPQHQQRAVDRRHPGSPGRARGRWWPPRDSPRRWRGWSPGR